MDPDFLKAFIKQAVGSSVKAGAIDLVTNMAESFSADELDRLIAILQGVAKKKRGTIDTTGAAAPAR